MSKSGEENLSGCEEDAGPESEFTSIWGQETRILEEAREPELSVWSRGKNTRRDNNGSIAKVIWKV